MKNVLIKIVVSLSTVFFLGCEGSYHDSVLYEDDPILYETDNEYTNWNFHGNNGYSGGDVEFAGIRMIGEWSIIRTLNNSEKSPTFDIYSSVIFNDISLYSYEPNSDLLYQDGYGVSRDGLTLTIDSYHKYTVESITWNENQYGYCINTVEDITEDVYQFCKVY